MRCFAATALIFLCSCFAIFAAGCSANYNYCSLDTSAYSKPYKISLPEHLPEYCLTEQMLNEPQTLPEFISIKDNVAYISSPSLTNFVVTSISDYCLCFTTNAVLTITDSLRNYAGSCIISTAQNLTLVLKGNIYSGNQPQQYLQAEQPKEFFGAVLASNINVFGSTCGIYASDGICLQADTINLNGGKIITDSQATALVANNINIYGESVSIVGTDAINAQNVNIFGGIMTIKAQKCAINCIFLRIFNGKLNINSKQTAINCKTLQKSGGFVKLAANYGLKCDDINISNGLFYASCTYACMAADKQISISGGTNLFVSNGEHSACIEASNIPFACSGGLTLQCSGYTTKPTDGIYYGFKLAVGHSLFLQTESSCLCYTCPADSSVCITGSIVPTSYTTSGRINKFSGCFYGILFNVDANLYSLANIAPNKSQNFGADWCNLGAINNFEGQLF